MREGGKDRERERASERARAGERARNSESKSKRERGRESESEDTAFRPEFSLVQVTIGQARLLQSATGKVPALVVRTDVANIYGTKAPPLPFCDLQHPDIVLQALQMDACGVICNLFVLPDDAPGAVDLHRKCIQNVTHLRSADPGRGAAWLRGLRGAALLVPMTCSLALPCCVSRGSPVSLQVGMHKVRHGAAGRGERQYLQAF